MKISSFNLKNKFICYKNLMFDFSSFGIYKINGENGTGKTSIIEKIVFGNYSVHFEEEMHLQLWKKKRYELFTYIPQATADNNLNVGEYICKGNRNIKTEDALLLLNAFGLDASIVSQKFKILSGGEKKKIQIISGLLKDTPYIFLDEPTNNLDNASVDCLNKILDKLKYNKTIILISHDERLAHSVITEYCLDGKNLYSVKKQAHCVNKECCKNIEISTKKVYSKKLSFFKILAPVLRNYGQIITACIFCCMSILLSLYANYEFKNGLNEDIPIKENVILVQGNTNFDEELLSYYLKGEHISVDEALQSRYLNLIDIYEDISKLEGIEKIYITDVKYQAEIESMIANGTIGNELHFVSCPQEYVQDCWDYSIVDYGLGMLQGQFPKDGELEVALSKNLLCTYFGYTDATVSNAIGDSVSLSICGIEKLYRIVGFTYFDYVLVSYNEDVNFGIYCYDESTFGEFGISQIQFEIDRDGWPAMIRESIILTAQGYEAKILNHLVTHYPAGDFLSHHYCVVWAKTFNTKRFIDVLIPNLIIAVILSIAFIIINHYAIKYNFSLLWDYGNYYINRNKMKLIYCVLSLSLYLLIALLAIILNYLISPYAYMSSWYLIIDSCITLVPLGISYFIKKGKWKF